MQYRKLFLWLLTGLAALFYIRYSTDRVEPDTASDITLPADSPDIYVTGMALSRYDDQGIRIMTVNADTLAVYNTTGQSLLGQPVVLLRPKDQNSWRVTAEQAIILANDNIEFKQNVVAEQVSSLPATVVRSDVMIISDQGQRISSDLEVNIVKGGQTVDAVGMDVKLNTLEPVIELLSEVTFVYEPS